MKNTEEEKKRVPFKVYNPPPDDKEMWNVTVTKIEPLFNSGKITTINLYDPKLYATQKYVCVDTIKKHNSGAWRPKNFPVVIRLENGNMYIQDGHHRLSERKFSGAKTAKVYMVDRPSDYVYEAKINNKKYTLKNIFFPRNKRLNESSFEKNVRRLHYSKTKIDKIVSKSQDERGFKPVGFWYSVGDAWERWAVPNMYEIGDIIYNVELDFSKILLISNIEELNKFTDEYSTDKKDNSNINWKRVAEKYSGIEINPYIHEGRYSVMWYYTWDIASGCVWDASAIKNIVRLSNPDGKNEKENELEEEYIGSNGGLSYFQMGSSLPSGLYNRTNKGKPTRSPGIAGIKKESKYSLYNTFIKEAARNPNTIPEDVKISIEPFMGNIVVKYLENSSGVEGYVEMKLAKEGNLGAYIIFQSEATKGYGPLLYDLALEVAGKHGVTSDKGSVSPAASAVWEYYYKNRSDVSRRPLDNKDNPKTPEKEDDTSFDVSYAGGAISFGMGDEEKEIKRPWLNFVYYATSRNNFTTLKKMGKIEIDKSLVSENTVPQGSASTRPLHGAPIYFNPTGRTLPKKLKDNGSLKRSRKWNKNNNLINVKGKIKDEKRKDRWYKKENIYKDIKSNSKKFRQNNKSNSKINKKPTKKEHAKGRRPIEKNTRLRISDIFLEGPIIDTNRYRKDYSQGVEVDLMAINKPFYYSTDTEYASGDYIEQTDPNNPLIFSVSSDEARNNNDNLRVYRVQPIGNIEWVNRNNNASTLSAPMLKVIDENQEI